MYFPFELTGARKTEWQTMSYDFKKYVTTQHRASMVAACIVIM